MKTPGADARRKEACVLVDVCKSGRSERYKSERSQTITHVPAEQR
jgi:hypothetical protein